MTSPVSTLASSGGEVNGPVNVIRGAAGALPLLVIDTRPVGPTPPASRPPAVVASRPPAVVASRPPAGWLGNPTCPLLPQAPCLRGSGAATWIANRRKN